MREAPSRIGWPRSCSTGRAASSAQLWSAFLAKPRPGSSTRRSSVEPRAEQRVTPRGQLAAYVLDDVVVDGPRLHLGAVAAPVHRDVGRRRFAATAGTISGSARPPETSLTMRRAGVDAPRRDLGAASCRWRRRPLGGERRTTGRTRRSSSSTEGRSAPGRVDSPPTSTMSAPRPRASRPWAMAASGSNHWPPSEKESGVTLTTPMTSVRSVTEQRRASAVAAVGGRREPGAVMGAIVSRVGRQVTCCPRASAPWPLLEWPGRAAGRARPR